MERRNVRREEGKKGSDGRRRKETLEINSAGQEDPSGVECLPQTSRLY